MKECFAEMFDSNFNTSGSGFNINVVKLFGPNVPKQLAARIWIYNLIKPIINIIHYDSDNNNKNVLGTL